MKMRTVGCCEEEGISSCTQMALNAARLFSEEKISAREAIVRGKMSNFRDLFVVMDDYDLPFPNSLASERCEAPLPKIDGKSKNDALLQFSKGKAGDRETMLRAGLTNYRELLDAMEDRHLPLPILPQERLNNITQNFVRLLRLQGVGRD
jgi:hypothetical protein